MSVSVNTNVSAMQALENLNLTTTELSQTQNIISTGLKVSSAKDNAAIYAIAQNQRSQVAALDAVSSSLSRGQSVVDLASTAAQSISDLVSQMKQAALAASDTSISTASRSAYATQFNSLRDQITQVSNNASFDGANLLITGASNLDSLSNTAGGVVTVLAQTMSLHGIGLTATASIATPTLAASWATALDTVQNTVNTKMGALGTYSTELQNQITYVSHYQDALNTGIGNLVDANMAQESAKLQALQTKQQLGVQSLSIANQSPQLVLSLFK